DDYICKIWGIDKIDVLTVHLAHKRGITPSYKVIGDFEWDEELTLPKSSYGKALNFLGFITKIFHKVPYIDDERCIECFECEKRCPKDAINVSQKDINYGKCIRCYVCHEVCPNKAIRLKRRFFLF
ncbi:MAG: ATP-binding protein, partial [Petrotogales bacterium]